MSHSQKRLFFLFAENKIKRSQFFVRVLKISLSFIYKQLRSKGNNHNLLTHQLFFLVTSINVSLSHNHFSYEVLIECERHFFSSPQDDQVVMKHFGQNESMSCSSMLIYKYYFKKRKEEKGHFFQVIDLKSCQ